MALTTAAAVAASSQGLSAADITAAGVIGRADVLLARLCGYRPASAGAAPTLESATYTLYTGDPGVYTDPRDRRSLIVEPYPVTAITSIHDDSNEDYTAAELVASGDYVQRGHHGERIRLTIDSAHGAWSRSPRAIKLVVTAGYTTVRDDLEAAAIELCLHLMSLRHRRGHQTLTAEGLTHSYRSEDIPPQVRSMVGPYMLPSVYA
jgi:hypothetical protein